jgi:hypothetical protein
VADGFAGSAGAAAGGCDDGADFGVAFRASGAEAMGDGAEPGTGAQGPLGAGVGRRKGAVRPPYGDEEMAPRSLDRAREFGPSFACRRSQHEVIEPPVQLRGLSFPGRVGAPGAALSTSVAGLVIVRAAHDRRIRLKP